jgi:hypothetical protein
MKKRMKMLENDKPKDQPEEGKKPMEGEAAPTPPAKDEGKPDHDDEKADMELIKKMLDERLGEGKHTEDDQKACHEAMKMAMEAGEPKEEAMKCAGYAMKMARHMAAKAPSEPSADKPQESKEGETTESKESKEKKETAVKESAKKADDRDAELIKLKAENAAFREAAKKADIMSHLEKVCRESRLPMATTKVFRELVGEAKTKEEVDSKFKIFIEAFKQTESGEALDFADTLHHPEAGATAEPVGDEPIGFGDCTNE